MKKVWLTLLISIAESTPPDADDLLFSTSLRPAGLISEAGQVVIFGVGVFYIIGSRARGFDFVLASFRHHGENHDDGTSIKVESGRIGSVVWNVHRQMGSYPT